MNTTSAAEDRKQLPAAQLPPAEGFVTASVAAPTAEGATPGVGVEAAAETPEALEASEDESAADAAKVSQLPYTWYQVGVALPYTLAALPSSNTLRAV